MNMMNDSAVNVLLGQLRTVMAAVGGVFVTRGLISGETLNQIIGVMVIIVPAVWSAWDKIRAEQAAKAREVIAVNAGIAVSNLEPAITPPIPAAVVPEILKTFAPPTEVKP